MKKYQVINDFERFDLHKNDIWESCQSDNIKSEQLYKLSSPNTNTYYDISFINLFVDAGYMKEVVECLVHKLSNHTYYIIPKKENIFDFFAICPQIFNENEDYSFYLNKVFVFDSEMGLQEWISDDHIKSMLEKYDYCTLKIDADLFFKNATLKELY